MEEFHCKDEKWYYNNIEINGYKTITQNKKIIYQGELLEGK